MKWLLDIFRKQKTYLIGMKSIEGWEVQAKSMKDAALYAIKSSHYSAFGEFISVQEKGTGDDHIYIFHTPPLIKELKLPYTLVEKKE